MYLTLVMTRSAPYVRTNNQMDVLLQTLHGSIYYFTNNVGLGTVRLKVYM